VLLHDRFVLQLTIYESNNYIFLLKLLRTNKSSKDELNMLDFTFFPSSIVILLLQPKKPEPAREIKEAPEKCNFCWLDILNYYFQPMLCYFLENIFCIFRYLVQPNFRKIIFF
jgi:hypothetical protein